MSETHYQSFFFREAKSADELDTLLRLRYNVYKKHHPKFIPDNPFGLDLDCYDRNSRHFGVFGCTHSGIEKAVGYLRVILDEPSPFAGFIEQVAASYGSKMLETVQAKPKEPFPSMIYFPDGKETLGERYQQMKSKGERLCEAGRFCLLPEVESLRLGRFVVESAIAAFYFGCRLHNAIISCSAVHYGLYRFYHFKQVEGTTAQNVNSKQDLLLLLLLRYKQDMSAVLQEKFELMSAHFLETGRIEYVPKERRIEV